MKAMIFAAGLGTRLKPFTLKHPKALAPINGTPVLQKNIAYLQSFGINEFVINVHHFADQIIDFLKENNHFGATIHISHEREEALETGGGLLLAKEQLIEDDFIVMNADILTDLDLNLLVENHKKSQAIATLAVSDRQSSRKLHFDKQMHLKGWENLNSKDFFGQTKDTMTLAFSGIQVLSPAFVKQITETGKFSIMKPYLRLMESEHIQGFDHSGGKLLDIGKPKSLQLAQELF